MFGSNKRRCRKCKREEKQGEKFAENISNNGGFICDGCIDGRVVQTEPQDTSWIPEYFESMKSKNYPPLRVRPIKTEDGKRAWEIVDKVLPENVVLGLGLDAYHDEVTVYYRLIDENTFSLCKNQGY